MSEEKVTIATKRKNLQNLLDYCLDNRISFTINPKGIISDEFDAILSIQGIKEGIALGMFAKEHKFELLGYGDFAKIRTTHALTSKKVDAKENEVTSESLKTEQQPVITSVLNF
jgi:hypothetical protein